MTAESSYSAANLKPGYASLSASIGVDVDAHAPSSIAAPAQTGSVVSMNHATAAAEKSAVEDLDISMIVSLVLRQRRGTCRVRVRHARLTRPLLAYSFRDPKPKGGFSVILIQAHEKYTSNV